MLFVFVGPAAKYRAHICAAVALVPLTCVGGLPALICAAERLVPICADGAVPALTWNDAVPAPIWEGAVSALPVLLPTGGFVFLRPLPRPRLTTTLILPPRPVSILNN
jgi:hypothetical protein